MNGPRGRSELVPTACNLKDGAPINWVEFKFLHERRDRIHRVRQAAALASTLLAGVWVGLADAMNAVPPPGVLALRATK